MTALVIPIFENSQNIGRLLQAVLVFEYTLMDTPGCHLIWAWIIYLGESMTEMSTCAILS